MANTKIGQNTMAQQQLVDEVKNRLINTYNPTEIYLFGSYAWGSPDEESDLDILVVVKEYEKDRYHDLVKGHRALAGLSVPKDILLYTQDEFSKISDDITSFCYKIKKKEKKIYAEA